MEGANNKIFKHNYEFYSKFFEYINVQEIYLDIHIPTKRGYEKIDLLLVTKKRIYMIVYKDFNGDISGSQEHVNWTQISNENKIYEFVNPLKEVEAKRTALGEYLELEHSITNIIVFDEGTTFSNMEFPKGFHLTTKSDLEELIFDFETRIKEENKYLANNNYIFFLDLYKNTSEEVKKGVTIYNDNKI